MNHELSSRNSIPLIFWWTPAVGCMVTLFVLSSIEQLHPPGPEFDLKDKLYHAAAYGALTTSVVIALHPKRDRISVLRRVILASALSIGFGVTDEIHQMFVPTRSAEVADAVADACGSLLASAMCFALLRRRSG